ncbi:MAG: FlgD immunoglobulin-like domain containing protein, partial [Candidatus Neomarinimicrobiota bacterium]
VHDNYPNPFNPITTIQYELPNHSDVKVTLFDITGRAIKEIDFGEMVPGRYAYVWDGTNEVGNLVSTGIYFFQINAGSNTDIKKMLLLK